MTWIWVVLLIVGLVGFLAWAAIRNERNGGSNFAKKPGHDAARYHGDAGGGG